MKKRVYTVPVNKKWGNRYNKVLIGGLYNLKADAVAQGRIIAIQYQTEHTILKQNGLFGSSNSYGNDPFPPIG